MKYIKMFFSKWATRVHSRASVEEVYDDLIALFLIGMGIAFVLCAIAAYVVMIINI